MSINFNAMTEEQLMAPEFYKTGDRGWITSQLAFLNLEQKKTACAEYREIYLTKGRKEANSYLDSFVTEHGDKSNLKRTMSVQSDSELPEGFKRRIERLKSYEKKTILGMSDAKRGK